jgi:hypothetical protein
MNRTRLFFIALILGAYSLISSNQLIAQDPIQINGFITTADSGKTIPFATIISRNTGKGVYSNFMGYYTLLVDRKDTLEVRALGFSNYYFTIPDNHNSPYFSYNAALLPISYELTEIVFQPWSYENVLAKARNIPLPGSANISISDPTIGLGYAPNRSGVGLVLSGPFTALYNKFSRKGKEMERLRTLLSENDIPTEAAKKLTPEIIQKVTGLNYDDIQDFVKYCQMGADFVKTASTYDLMIAIDKCFSQFIVAYPELDPANKKTKE